jgi:hypothetical protein
MEKATIAYPASTDAQDRETLAAKLHELGECYGKIAESAMRRKDRYAVFEAVKAEREAHNRAYRVEKGLVRF